MNPPAGSRGGDRPSEPAPLWHVVVCWCALVAILLGLGLGHLEDTGLYYDEAFLAQQARDFVEPERAAVHATSVRTAYILGRPFPLRNAAYLGSLKSQLLIPFLATFGSDTRVLRLSTLATSLIALLFAMLWVRQLAGNEVACVMGWLVALDPSFFFFSQFEWGPFTTLFLCRSLGFFLLGVGFTAQGKGRWWAFIGGGALLGLGVYSRADFALILAAGVLGVLLCRRDWIFDGLSRHRGPLIAGAAALVVAASPMLLVIGQLADANAGMKDRGDLAYRIDVLTSSFDGSHWYRVMESGGRFSQLFEIDAPATGFLAILATAIIVLILSRRSLRSPRNILLCVVMGSSLALSLVMLPGAVRAHHMLDLLPLPQLIVAFAGIALWQRSWATPALQWLTRGCVVACFAAISIGNVHVIRSTQSLMEETAGRGRFAKVLSSFAHEIDARPDARATTLMSLDWGFHENLSFLTQNVTLREPIWTAEAATRRGQVTNIFGNQKSIYLVHEGEWVLVGMGNAFLAALDRIDPATYERTIYSNRKGEAVFSAVRILSPHRLRYRGGMEVVFE